MTELRDTPAAGATSDLDVAVFHHLPTGGALRVLAEWASRTGVGSITIYTPDPSVHRFAALPASAQVRDLPWPAAETGFGTGVSLLRLPRVARAAARVIDRGGHDVVFAFPSRLSQAPPLLSSLRTPHLYYAPEPLRSAHEDPALVFAGDGLPQRVSRAGLNPIERLRERVDRLAMAGARRLVTHSAFTRDELARIYGVEADVVALGVDAAAFGADPPNAAEERASGAVRPADRPYVLSVGALHPLKGHDLVVEALGRMPTPRPRLIIVGDRGQGAGALLARAGTLGVDLDLRQGLAFAEVVALYRRAAVVACAQIREPFGLVPLEAMAAGRPVVAVDEGGLRETIRDAETGVLVPRDAGRMAEAIGGLLGDPQRADRLGARGRDEMARHWTWGAYAARIDALLAEAAAAGRPAQERR